MFRRLTAKYYSYPQFRHLKNPFHQYKAYTLPRQRGFSRASAIMFMGCENGGRVRKVGFSDYYCCWAALAGWGYRYLPSYYNPFAPLQLARSAGAGSRPSNYSALRV